VVNKLEEERGRIARDLHDGVGQSLIILKNKVIKKSDYSAETQDQLNDNFSEIIEEIRSISRSLIPPELKRLGLRKAVENRLNEVAQCYVHFCVYRNYGSG
jgi:signal transduction histidine kinase